jgi:hypothetical protein
MNRQTNDNDESTFIKSWQYAIVPVTLALTHLSKFFCVSWIKNNFFCYSLKLNFICYLNRFFTFVHLPYYLLLYYTISYTMYMYIRFQFVLNYHTQLCTIRSSNIQYITLRFFSIEILMLTFVSCFTFDYSLWDGGRQTLIIHVHVHVWSRSTTYKLEIL